MATDKQVEYVCSLQGQTSLTDYSRKEIKAMTHKEVSNLISELQDDISVSYTHLRAHETN